MRITSFIFFVLIATGIFVSSCKKHNDTSATTNTINVMFVNGFVGASYVNASVNGTILATAGKLTFMENSGYQSITTGSNVGLGFIFPGPPPTGDGFSISVQADSYYSFFLGGSQKTNNVTIAYTNDDLTLPVSGMAKVRFVNLSPDTLNLNCFIGGQKLDSNIMYGTVTPFSQIQASIETAVLLNDPSRPIESATLSQSFLAGQIYTIILTGSIRDTLTNQLALAVINN